MIYELLYIVSSAFAESDIAEIMKDIEKLVKDNGGEIRRHESLAKLTLAYPIKRMKHGTYVLMHLSTSTEAIKKLDRTLRLDWSEKVLRHTIMKVPSGQEALAFDLVGYTYPLAEGVVREARKPRSSAVIAPPTPAVSEPAMSVEEIDKKLDQILEDDSLTSV